jgi:hypothetical protein
MGLNEANINFAIEISNIPYSEYYNSISDIEIPKQVSPDLVRKIVTDYYECLSNKDYGRLSQFYTPVLERYYTEFNISSAKAARNASEYWEKYKILQTSTNIQWDTFKAVSLSTGDVMISFNMHYVLLRTESNKPSRFNLDINIVLNPDFKIKSIFENIISKI